MRHREREREWGRVGGERGCVWAERADEGKGGVAQISTPVGIYHT